VTIEDLKAIAQRALDFGIERIRETGELHQMFHLVGREKTKIIMCGGDVTNDEDAKQELSEHLKARVRGESIDAVIMVSDTYIAEATREQDAIRRAFGMTIEDMFKAGMIPKREAVTVTLESPIYAQCVTQEYRRAEDDDKRVELVGAPVITSTVEDANGISGKYRGRFMNWFPEAREGRA
jgi:hypothetical protein